MESIARLLFPVIFLLAFSLLSMMRVDLPIEGKRPENHNTYLVEQNKFYPALAAYASNLEAEFDQIPADRQAELQALANYISEKNRQGQVAKVTVICTHNSRRSHLGQLWLLAAARWYGLEKVETFSGGTEATAFHPNAVQAMREAGFGLEKMDDSVNPVYRASLGEDWPVGELFSKKYDHEANPQRGFAAMLVCAEADAACPFVPGAEARFPIRYEDPKAFDGTDRQAAAYAERCRQIGREMFFTIKNARAAAD